MAKEKNKDKTKKEKKSENSQMLRLQSADLGMTAADQKQIVNGLSALLADSFTLYLKTHKFHWNVEGPMFRTLHLMFMEQYTELWNALDEIAERIRALGAYAPGSNKQFSELATIKESHDVPEAMKMVKDLLSGHEAVIKTAREVLEPADRASDEATIDLITQRLQVHEKTAWMLRSILQ